MLVSYEFYKDLKRKIRKIVPDISQRRKLIEMLENQFELKIDSFPDIRVMKKLGYSIVRHLEEFYENNKHLNFYSITLSPFQHLVYKEGNLNVYVMPGELFDKFFNPYSTLEGYEYFSKFVVIRLEGPTSYNNQYCLPSTKISIDSETMKVITLEENNEVRW